MTTGAQIMVGARIVWVKGSNKMVPEINLEFVLNGRKRLTKIKGGKRVPETRKTIEVEMFCEIGFRESVPEFVMSG
jgi:hypothetical protein